MGGTTGASQYGEGGDMECDMQFFGGNHDTDFEKGLQAIDCQMMKEMSGETSVDEDSNVVTFMQQMIPHHENAVNMAKLLMKQDMEAVSEVEDLEGILYSIINVQNFQIHQFRNYLNAEGKLLESPYNIELVDPIDRCSSSSSASTSSSTLYPLTLTLMYLGYLLG